MYISIIDDFFCRAVQNVRYFVDDIFKCVALNEKKILFCFEICYGVFVHANEPSLGQVMAWCQKDNESLA